MRSVWLCWALWVLPLADPGVAVTEEQILSSLLQQLRLREVPVLDERDAEELVTPAHVGAQYVALLRRSHGAPSRGKRFSQNFRGEASLPAAPWALGGGGEGARLDGPIWGSRVHSAVSRDHEPCGRLGSVCTEGPTPQAGRSCARLDPLAKLRQEQLSKTLDE